MPLASLIKAISGIQGIERVRLGSLEPSIITEEFVEVISQIEEFCPHFHLSLQSGSNSVLKRMNRKYTREEYEEKVKLLRKYFDKPAFTTDLIVGFPGESQSEFEESLEYVQRIGFSGIHVFKYSKRAGTVAAKMPDQIPEEIKNTRSNILIDLADQMSRDYKTMFLGKIERILVEEEILFEGRRYKLGHNERYLKFATLVDEDKTNQIIRVKAVGNLTKDILLADII
jgi:threonylcarbamoyladenosine tRNA methylthiotransferase MtaB